MSSPVVQGRKGEGEGDDLDPDGEEEEPEAAKLELGEAAEAAAERERERDGEGDGQKLGHLVPLQAMHARFCPAITRRQSPPRPCQGCEPWLRTSANSGLVLATQNLG